MAPHFDRGWPLYWALFPGQRFTTDIAGATGAAFAAVMAFERLSAR
jgi:hypothetical protein